MIFQIGNCEDMAVGTPEGELAVKVLDEYVKDLRNAIRHFMYLAVICIRTKPLHNLHIDFVPYVTGWKGKGMDTRVSLKQALKSIGFQGGNKHDTELNQWINNEKEVLAEIMERYGIEWERKGTHEEHLDVYNFKKKERAKEVKALEREKEFLTAENEVLSAQIAESKADINVLEQEKKQTVKEKEKAEQRAEKAEKELQSIEERRKQLQTIMNQVDRELKKIGKVDLLLPEAGSLERASTYRDKKIKPLFIKMKNYVATMAAKVLEVTEELEKWKNKYQRLKIDYNNLQKDVDETWEYCNRLSADKERLQIISDRHDRVMRVLEKVSLMLRCRRIFRLEKALEEKQRREHTPQGIHDRLKWVKKEATNITCSGRKIGQKTGDGDIRRNKWLSEN